MAAPTQKYSCVGGMVKKPSTGLSYYFGKAGPSGFGSASTAEQVAASWNGEGKTVIITGASAGLGAETARVLSGRGAEVIMAVRDLPKVERIRAKILKANPSAKLVPMELDLSSLASVKAFAEAFKATGKPLHTLILNAGIMACPFSKTKDGFETQFGTNHLSHFLLTKLLLPSLLATAEASGCEGRVVSLASTAHFMAYKEGVRFECLDNDKGYNEWGAYGQSKLCNVLFARELAARLEGQPVVAVAVHPGVINTELGRHLPIPGFLRAILFGLLRPIMKSIPAGSATQTYVATAAGVKRGEYYADCNIADSSPHAHNAELGRKLWDISEKLVAQYL